MKLVKSLLLGSAAGLVAVAGASAADLGVKKPTAVEYVKTCPTYGAGFFVVPGTTSCLKIVGRVRLDARVDAPVTRAGNKTATRARAYVGFDHRTATEYGLLRTYARAFFQHQSGLQQGASTVALEYAFIQFGGLTAGRVAPAFEHGWNQFFLSSGSNFAGGYHSDVSYVNSIGYTANFGGGFSATVTLDDGSDRHSYGSTSASVADLGTGVVTTTTTPSRAGHSMPDITGALVYDQSWGTVRLAGAIGQHRSSVGGAFSTKYGYAVEGGLKVNLPMLTKGSNFWVSGSYGQGMVSYTGYSPFGATSVGGVSYTAADFNAAGRLATSYGVMGALQVYATPTVAVSVGASYGVYNPAGAANSYKGLTVLGQVAWMPVAGFMIGAETAYRSVTASTGLIAAGTKKNDIVGRIRFQRDF